MSRTASLELRGYLRSGIRVRDLLSAMISAGWSYDDHGHISYLPLGDGDVSNWTWRSLADWAAVVEEIERKLASSETAGVVLLAAEGRSGGELLMTPSLEVITLILSANRKTLPGASQATDYSWYIARMVPPLEKLGFEIERMTCTDRS
jgi:hypothetical protein